MQNLQIPNNRNAQKRPISPNVTGDARTVVDSLSNSVLQITREIASFEDEKVESFAELQRKTNETNDKLRQLRTALQDAQDLAQEQEKESDRNVILSNVDRMEQQASRLQSELRNAVLACNKRLEKQTANEREELLTASHQAKQVRQRKTQNEQVTSASNQLTDSLRTAVQMLNVEVERSSVGNKALADQTSTVQQTNSEYSTYGSTLGIGRDLVTKLKSRDWIDRLLLAFGVLVFILTVLYIVKRRLWFIPNPVGWLWSLARKAT